MVWFGMSRALMVGMVVSMVGACAKEGAPAAASSSGGAAPAADDGMAMYAGQLYGCLQEMFAPPEGISPGLAAHLQVKLSDAGEVAGENIAQSSGHADFDAALLAAVGRCRQVPPPPPSVLALLQQQGLTLLFKR